MNSFIFLRNKSRWLLLFVWTNSKKPFRSKTKIIYVNNSLHMCVWRQEELSGKSFQPVRYRDYENLSNKKTPLEYNKVLKIIQFISRPSCNLLGGEKLLVAVMKQWSGEKLEISFYWTSIFMMRVSKAYVLLSFDLNPQRLCQT